MSVSLMTVRTWLSGFWGGYDSNYIFLDECRMLWTCNLPCYLYREKAVFYSLQNQELSKLHRVFLWTNATRNTRECQLNVSVDNSLEFTEFFELIKLQWIREINLNNVI